MSHLQSSFKSLSVHPVQPESNMKIDSSSNILPCLGSIPVTIYLAKNCTLFVISCTCRTLETASRIATWCKNFVHHFSTNLSPSCPTNSHMTRENCLPFSDKWARIPADSINQQSRFYTMKPDGGSPLCDYEDTPVLEATELYGMFLGLMSFGAESLPK